MFDSFATSFISGSRERRPVRLAILSDSSRHVVAHT